MTITGIDLDLMFCTGSGFNDTIEANIPFTGDTPVLTEVKRCERENEIKKYKLTRETIDSFLALIEKYGITDRIGKEPSVPKTASGGDMMSACFLTLYFDDGTKGRITFREVPEETGREAAFAFRRLFFDSAKDEALISSEFVYPTLKECREIKEEHGPVTAIETGSFTMGMMYGSNETYTQLIEKVEGKEGTVRVTIKRQRGNDPEETNSKEICSDIFSKVQEISDRENLPCWFYVAKDPSLPVDNSMRPMDYSASGWLNIYYDDSLITGFPKVKRTIGETACELGGKEVDKALTALINECVAASGAKVDMTPPPFPGKIAMADPNAMPINTLGMMQTMQIGMMAGVQAGMQTPSETKEPPAESGGPWDCSCGAKGLTGKFCSECGYPRP